MENRGLFPNKFILLRRAKLWELPGIKVNAYFLNIFEDSHIFDCEIKKNTSIFQLQEREPS